MQIFLCVYNKYMLQFSKKYIYNDLVKPLCIIKKNDKKYGFVSYENGESDEEDDIVEEIDNYTCQYCKRRFNRPQDVKRHQNGGSCKQKLINDFVQYNRSGSKIANGDIVVSKNGVKLYGDYKFAPLADMKNRENILIIGPQNSGKSYYASMYADSFKKIKPEHNIILVSRIEDDQAFDNIDHLLRVRISDELLNNPIDIKKEMSKSLAIFDDIEDSTLSKDTQKYMFDLNSEVLINGRDQAKQDNDIYSITTLHISEGFKTRKIINESTSYVVFLPLGYQSERILKTYANLKKPLIDKINKMSSRWVAVYCKYRPTYILTEKELILL